MHLGEPRPIADEQEQHPGFPDGECLRGLEHGVEAVRAAEVAGVEDDEAVFQALLTAEPASPASESGHIFSPSAQFGMTSTRRAPRVWSV